MNERPLTLESVRSPMSMGDFSTQTVSADRLAPTENHKCGSKMKETPGQAGPNPRLSDHDVIQKGFYNAKSQWIDDPVTTQWRSPNHPIHQILSEVNSLYHDWKSVRKPPFAPSPSPLWLDTARTLAAIGLPWHGNQVNMAHQVDSSWPFHFKSFEAQLLQTMGSRVGEPDPSGYVANYNEANCFCIRAVQKDLRRKCPAQKPLLVYDHFNLELIELFEKLFGLDTHRVFLSGPTQELEQDLLTATAGRKRPIIFAATVGNSAVDYDDISTILELSSTFPITLHIDAFRNFNYITTMSESQRQQEGMEKFTLRAKQPEQSLKADDGSIIAGSMVAGGLNHSDLAPALSLTPVSHGTDEVRVAYIRSYDSTLCGSRDTVAPIWLALHDLRLGETGLQELCQYLLNSRSKILQVLQSQGISAHTSPYSPDIVVDSCSLSQRQWLLDLGGTASKQNKMVLAIQPQLFMAAALSSSQPPQPSSDYGLISETLPIYKDFADRYPVPEDALVEIHTTIQSWKSITRLTIGFPVHMGSLAALGPVISRFWDLSIPQDWLDTTSRKLLADRLRMFGIADPEIQQSFKGGFTNGSTMGNRCGIHTAIAQFPGAFVYVSADAHYSVLKILRDCDTITNIWSSDRRPHYSEIPSDGNGSICIDALVTQALVDKKYCVNNYKEYHMILFANYGTTFMGARDDIHSISTRLNDVGIKISYIHVDGALDLGYGDCGIKLGLPDTFDIDGMPLVQGITISHHKALGQGVSGEVFCFSPKAPISGLSPSFDPRVVFETWLYSRLFASEEKSLLLDFCRANASLVEEGLVQRGLVTKRFPDSLVVVFERPAAWLIEEFSLRPEGDWVHIITMPHVSREVLELFLDQLSSVDKSYSTVFRCMGPLVSDIVGRRIKLQRVSFQSSLAKRIFELAESAAPLYSKGASVRDFSQTVKTSLRGAVSIAAIDEEGQLQAVLLAGSNRDRSMLLGPILVNYEFGANIKGIRDVRDHLTSVLAKSLGSEIKTDAISYDTYTFGGRLIAHL